MNCRELIKCLIFLFGFTLLCVYLPDIEAGNLLWSKIIPAAHEKGSYANYGQCRPRAVCAFAYDIRVRLPGW